MIAAMLNDTARDVTIAVLSGVIVALVRVVWRMNDRITRLEALESFRHDEPID